MRVMQSVLVSVFVVAMAVSGCLDGDDGVAEEEDPPVITGPPNAWVTGYNLTDLACDYLYPDNETALSCENQFDELSVQPEPPGLADGWVCVDDRSFNQPHPASYSIHWNPGEELHGLHYNVPNLNGTISGVIWSARSDVGLVWYDQEPNGFIQFPQLSIAVPPQGVFNSAFQIYLYTHEYTSDTPELANGTIRANWSFYDDTPYPLQEVTTDSGSYFFNNATVRPGEGDSDTYRVQSFTMVGEDFDIDVRSAVLHYRPTAWSHTVNTGCSGA